MRENDESFLKMKKKNESTFVIFYQSNEVNEARSLRVIINIGY